MVIGMAEGRCEGLSENAQVKKVVASVDGWLEV
jgi:hypothetical protein